MKRLFAILLSLLIVGTPTVLGAELNYRAVQENIVADTDALLQAETEFKSLAARAQELFAQAQEQLRMEEEEARKAEEATRLAAASAAGSIDLSAWQAAYPDVIGYIHSPGTVISYPIAYDGTDYYLHHNLDGVECVEGSIYLEKVNSGDFSDNNSILYGHHMKNGSMFASICRYKDPSYYYDHPYMFLYTADGNYRLEVVAGFPCPYNDRVFRTGFDAEQIADFMSRSTFTSAVTSPTGPFVTLVTCSYEADNYRYVLICEKVAV